MTVDSLPTLYLAECSLVYLEPSRIQTLVDSCFDLSTHFRAFLCYDPIDPEQSRFGQQMRSHFADAQCPLLGVDRYPTAQSHASRMSKWLHSVSHQLDRFPLREFFRRSPMTSTGFESAVMSDHNYERIDRLEPMDEWEEWSLVTSHYAISCAWNGDVFPSFAELWSL